MGTDGPRANDGTMSTKIRTLPIRALPLERWTKLAPARARVTGLQQHEEGKAGKATTRVRKRPDAVRRALAHLEQRRQAAAARVGQKQEEVRQALARVEQKRQALADRLRQRKQALGPGEAPPGPRLADRPAPPAAAAKAQGGAGAEEHLATARSRAERAAASQEVSDPGPAYETAVRAWRRGDIDYAELARRWDEYARASRERGTDVPDFAEVARRERLEPCPPGKGLLPTLLAEELHHKLRRLWLLGKLNRVEVVNILLARRVPTEVDEGIPVIPGLRERIRQVRTGQPDELRSWIESNGLERLYGEGADRILDRWRLASLSFF